MSNPLKGSNSESKIGTSHGGMDRIHNTDEASAAKGKENSQKAYST